MGFKGFIAILILGGLIFGVLVGGSVGRLKPESTGPNALAGKKTWQKNGCVECHTIFGNGGYNAPDLTHEASLRSGDWLNNFLTKGPIIRTAKKKRHLKLPLEQRRNIIAYLTFIDSIQVLGWPPKPQFIRQLKQ